MTPIQLADVVIIGGGTGGFAAALASAESGKSVILTEETVWIGGQLTSQAVPPTNTRGSKNSAAPVHTAGSAKMSAIITGIISR